MAEYQQLQYPFGKKIQVVFDSNPMQDRVYLDDEAVSGLRAVNVDSDMGERSVLFTVVHLPSGQEIKVEGYVVSAEHYSLLRRKEAIPPVEGEGIVGYFVEETDMRLIRQAPGDRGKFSRESPCHNAGSV